VDRFTGGVKDNALFNVMAADVELLQSSIEWELDRLPDGDWWKGLLILLLVSYLLFEGKGICPERITFAFDAFPPNKFTAGKSYGADQQQEQHLFHVFTDWLHKQS